MGRVAFPIAHFRDAEGEGPSGTTAQDNCIVRC